MGHSALRTMCHYMCQTLPGDIVHWLNIISSLWSLQLGQLIQWPLKGFVVVSTAIKTGNAVTSVFSVNILKYNSKALQMCRGELPPSLLGNALMLQCINQQVQPYLLYQSVLLSVNLFPYKCLYIWKETVAIRKETTYPSLDPPHNSM